MKKTCFVVMAFLASIVFVVNRADATAVLFLRSGASSVTVFDGGVGDLNAALGAVTFSGVVGTWTVNVTTGITMPIIGTATSPQMHLNSVNFGSGSLRMAFGEEGFNASGGATFDFSGLSNNAGDVTVSSYNTRLDFPWVINDTYYTHNFTGVTGPFTDSGFSAVNLSPTDRFFLVTDYVFATPSVVSYDYQTVVPEPGTLLLLGSGLLGLVAAGRKKFRK